MASSTDIALVKLQFRNSADFDWSDDDIGTLLDSGMRVLDTCVFICDSFVSKYTTSATSISVGPIKIDKSAGASMWTMLKKDIILRLQHGVGVPGGSGAAGIAVSGATLGNETDSQFYMGQFDNPQGEV